jgi:hypothetical protein
MPRDGLRNDGGELLAQLLDLGFQIRAFSIATSKFSTRHGEFSDQHSNLVARLGECAFADPSSHIPLLLPKFHRMNPKVSVSP